MRLSSSGFNQQIQEGKKKCLNSELWHACAGPLLSLPPAGSRVVYFPLIWAVGVYDSSTGFFFDQQGVETDEVYAQMTLQPLSPDYSQQPPSQELISRDLHDNEWKFRHIPRAAKEASSYNWNQLLLGIRRASHAQTIMPLPVLSSDSMHIGLLTALGYRASPSEFVIPLAKFVRAVHHAQVSVGMRFRMLFETEESSVRRYMGIITGISDLDPVHWQNSHWRSVKRSRDSIFKFTRIWCCPGMTRVDSSSIPVVQPDLYQAMASAALQEMRTVDSSKVGSQSVLQFQHLQSTSNGSSALIQRQMLQQSHTQSTFLQSFQGSQATSQVQLLQQLQHPKLYNDQRQQQQSQQTQNLPKLSVPQQSSNVIPAFTTASPNQTQFSSVPAVASQCQQQTSSVHLGNPIATSDVSSMQSILGSSSKVGASHLFNLNGSNPIISSSSSKPVATEPQLSAGAASCILPQGEKLVTAQSRLSNLSPAFPRREYSANHSSIELQGNSVWG
ncbi:hypothetical protein F3Y22_tig00110691pilonHSYRG00026 [Hibiscus syriacus]|uniref:Auxin response factor domain-containing protein n=1 Tax=Hibiscus syriacus TaxID=106335 RepID=A0A6A2ZWT2_HIBSY|nr:hypothetical protein F3Y22_tig00110691pilonHSYRG00026 [Hibiscus syriacus]